MFKTTAETRAYFDVFLKHAPDLPPEIGIVICPPFTALQTASGCLSGQSRVALGAQNVHCEPWGAFTGSISPPMLLDFGVQYVIVGHSERRLYDRESDEEVRRKTAAALDSGLTPIVAVGETLEIRETGGMRQHVVAQTRAALQGLDRAEIERIVLAYEPIWAIGTGHNCEPSDANDVMGTIRECVEGLAGVPILYGGSVKPGNIAQYVVQPEIDGGLVGGASLDPEGFAQLVEAAAA